MNRIYSLIYLRINYYFYSYATKRMHEEYFGKFEKGSGSIEWNLVKIRRGRLKVYFESDRNRNSCERWRKEGVCSCGC